MAFEKEGLNEYMTEVDLNRGVEVCKVVYVLGFRTGVDINKNNFYRIALKTCDDIKFSGMIFNLQNFYRLGKDINLIKGQFVKVKGVPQIYNNSYSFIINDIFTIDQDDVKDKELFIGKLKNAEELFNNCNRVMTNAGFNLPDILKFSSYQTIQDGKVGGYCKFLWDWMFSCMPLGDNLGKKFYTLLYKAVKVHLDYLDLVERNIDITPLDLLNILQGIQKSGDSEDNLIHDVCSSILGLTKPLHLYANYIKMGFDMATKSNNIISDWRSMAKGGVLTSEDYMLKKYC